jgi:acyl carrier protein
MTVEGSSTMTTANVMTTVQHTGDQAVFEVVRGVLAELLCDRGQTETPIVPEASVIEDLGLDSLAMVDLTVLLEDRLALREFPMQEWADAEAVRDGRRYTVASLVHACGALVKDR